MQKVYTKEGDKGYTKDLSGRRMRKDSPLIIAVGTIDTLQAGIDTALIHAKTRHRKFLLEIQDKLWQLSAEIARCDKKCLTSPITRGDLGTLENLIDSLGKPPKEFVHFNTQEAIAHNECRVRCRELERSLVGLLQKKQVRQESYAYVNRLSSLFFMLAYKSIKNR